MVSAGANIKSSSDALKKVDIGYLCNAIRNTESDLASKIEQIRIVRQLDVQRYTMLKQQLPYFVCAMFNPPFRRSENFAYTEYFIIDIDNISENNLTETDVRNMVTKDPRTMMCFKSPSGNGLKVMMKLSERCFDAGEYSIFYKFFVKQFSVQYGIEYVVDTRTSDVTRACFLSSDSEVYYNPNAEPVCMIDLLQGDEHYSIWNLKREAERLNNTVQEEKEPDYSIEPDTETIERIKAVLNPKLSKKKEKIPAYVPEILNEIITDLKTYIENTGLIVADIEDIQYGKKIKIKLGLKNAEVNLFYGKKGFSIVQSPKRCNNAELNSLVADLIQSYIDRHWL